MAGGVVLDHPVFDTDDVAPHGEIGGIELNAHAGGFEDAAALVDLADVVAEDSEVGDFAARRHVIGNGDELASLAFGAEQIDVWFPGDHQGCLAVEFRDGVVGHAVAKDDDILHYCS